jgi:acetyl-CoA carboxylase biotin carboxylase subunit
LGFTQNDITPTGWAIECRITSEDPANGFLPSTGDVDYLRIPSGPGVRWDGGIEVGSRVGLHYDPMLAKLIVYAPTRERAIERMHRALLELTISGIETSRDFHLRVMEDGEFQRGEIEIQWLERRLESLTTNTPPADGARIAALAGALLAQEDRARRSIGGAGVHTASNGNGTSDSAQTTGNQFSPVSAWRRAALAEGLR